MKRFVFAQLLAAALLLASNVQAQSLKDLLNKKNIGNVVSTIAGDKTPEMEGTWTYTGSAIKFESDNLLQSAGGSLAASAAEKQLDEQLGKIGISTGALSFTFNADSTFQAKLGGKELKGSYSYDTSTQEAELKFVRLIGVRAQVERSTEGMNLLFKSDKLLDLITLLSSKSNSTAMQAVSSLAEKYDGMRLGFALKKE